MSKVMVIAGELSGDMHAARVISKIKQLSPGIEVVGMGSKYLKEQGVEIILDPTAISSIGFHEAWKNIKLHREHLDMVKETITQEKPDVLFLVDYSGFNMLV